MTLLLYYLIINLSIPELSIRLLQHPSKIRNHMPRLRTSRSKVHVVPRNDVFSHIHDLLQIWDSQNGQTFGWMIVWLERRMIVVFLVGDLDLERNKKLQVPSILVRTKSLQGGGGRARNLFGIYSSRWWQMDVGRRFWGQKLLSIHITRYSYFQQAFGFWFRFWFLGLLAYVHHFWKQHNTKIPAIFGLVGSSMLPMPPEPQKNLLTFHYSGCFIRILILAYCNLSITGQYTPLYNPTN